MSYSAHHSFIGDKLCGNEAETFSFIPLKVTKLASDLNLTQRAFGAKMTSYQRPCDVITSHRR